MFNLQLKSIILWPAALLCVTLAAQDLQVAVFEPSGNRDVSQQFSLVRNAFIQTIVNANGFQVMDRGRTDQILREHDFQRNTGLLSANQARELGKMLGVDLILTSELVLHEDSLEINCQALDIVTGEIVGSSSVVLEEVTSKLIREDCQGMMEGLLKGINRKLSGGLNRASVDNSPQSILSGLDVEISRAIMNNRSNPKWNRNKGNYMMEVDLSNVNINENRQFGTSVQRVSGTIHITLSDSENEGNASVDIELDDFTEMGKNLIRRKIMAQMQPKIINIIRELLSELD